MLCCVHVVEMVSLLIAVRGPADRLRPVKPGQPVKACQGRAHLRDAPRLAQPALAHAQEAVLEVLPQQLQQLPPLRPRRRGLVRIHPLPRLPCERAGPLGKCRTGLADIHSHTLAGGPQQLLAAGATCKPSHLQSACGQAVIMALMCMYSWTPSKHLTGSLSSLQAEAVL